MPSERLQRRIDRLLDRAEEAADQLDWSLVVECVRAVLSIDQENPDAQGFLTMAEAALGERPDHGDSAALIQSLTPGETPVRPLPDSFVDGRYQVTDFLGEGGRKRVYLAHDSSLDRDVALAVIKTEGLDANGRQRIQREVQAMGRLSGHPHIVTIHDVGEEDGQQPFERRRYGQNGV